MGYNRLCSGEDLAKSRSICKAAITHRERYQTILAAPCNNDYSLVWRFSQESNCLIPSMEKLKTTVL